MLVVGVFDMQMDIHKSAPKGSLSIAQRQLLAEAAVALAFQRRQPMLLLHAAGAFAKLEQTAAAAQVGVDTGSAFSQSISHPKYGVIKHAPRGLPHCSNAQSTQASPQCVAQQQQPVCLENLAEFTAFF
jgi:hypothetical protein